MKPTVIRTECHLCGEVELGPEHIELFIIAESFYAFVCPACEDRNVKPADHRVVQLLISSGVQARPCPRPAEVCEPHAGAPLSYNDLIDLHFELEAM